MNAGWFWCVCVVYILFERHLLKKVFWWNRKIIFSLIFDTFLVTFKRWHQYTDLKTLCTAYRFWCCICLVSEFRQFFPQLTGILTLAFFIHNCIITLMKSNKYQENNVSLLNPCCFSLKLSIIFHFVQVKENKWINKHNMVIHLPTFYFYLKLTSWFIL